MRARWSSPIAGRSWSTDAAADRPDPSSTPTCSVTAASGNRPGILAGLRVIEVSAFVAVPLAGATLASLGAEVIRIDPIGGGIDSERWPQRHGVSLYWAGLNQGK